MSRRKLLLADDSITIQKVVNLTFADEGVDVVAVGDGDSALAELSAGMPDILLADVNMPGPTGYEICERLRSSEATQNLPVILLVGSFEPFDEAEASRVGANAYLTKPFQSIKQLIAQVNELIEAAKPAVEEPAAPAPATETQPAETEPQESEVDERVGAATEGESMAENFDSVPSGSVGNATEVVPRYFDDLGYETTVPPTESAPTPESNDEIERLYAQSLSGDANDLSDVGIDDEMIETSYSVENDNRDLAQFTPDVHHAEPQTYGSESASLAPAFEPETPASAWGETSGESGEGVSPGRDDQFGQDPSRYENTISYENWRPADMRSEVEAPRPTDVPQALETTKLDESFPKEAETVPPAVGEDTIRMENRFETTGSAFTFDDVNLLDLSNNSEEPVEITSPANAVEQGSSKQVVTLSPELIEMIAQRVVEKLSEKY